MRYLLLLVLATPAYGQVYSSVDLLATQIHSPLSNENWGGHDFSTRLEVGFERDCYGVRGRWWNYDESHEFAGTLYGIEFNVIDLEATRRFGDFLIAGGFRIADETHFVPSNPFAVQTSADTTQFGVTFAAEGDTPIWCGDCWGLSAVYGGRLSLLQGDWSWKPSVNSVLRRLGQYQNDQQTVVEGFAGLEAHYGRVFTRVALEMQNWHSNAMEWENLHNLGFTSIGTTVGVRF